MSLYHPDLSSIPDLDDNLKALELEFETPAAPAQCSQAYRGTLPAEISSSKGLYYMERKGTRVQLCKSRFRVIANTSILMAIGSKMTHTELLIQRATFQFMLGLEPVIPYIYFIPIEQMTYCETISAEKFTEIATLMATRICDKDDELYKPLTIVPAPEEFIDRLDKNDHVQETVDRLTVEFLEGEMRNVQLATPHHKSTEARRARMRKNGYEPSQKMEILQYFPPPVRDPTPLRAKYLQRNTGVWVEYNAEHVMTPAQASVKLCDIVMRDESTFVIDAYCGYGSDAAFLQQLPVALEVCDIDETRVEAAVQNIFHFCADPKMGVLASVRSFSSTMQDIAHAHGSLCAQERILIYVDPPWSNLVFSECAPFDFETERGRMSSYLTKYTWISFVLKVPISYNPQKLVDVRAVNGEYAFPDLGIKLLYYGRYATDDAMSE